VLGPPVSPERHWNTWDSAHPASLVHLPSRLAIRMAAYSARAGRYSDFPAGPSTRLLEHTADAGYVAAEVELAGTRVHLELAKPDPFAVVGRLTVVEAEEWALRFWLLLEIGYLGADEEDPSAVPTRVRLDPPAPGREYTEPVLVRARRRSRRACLVPSERPTYAGLYDDLRELREELEQGGYYRPHPEQPEGRWAVLRFNGQSQASTRFALAEATDDAAAERRARALLPEAEALIDAHASAAREGSEPARAVRDVVAWNTVVDDANQRWFTLLTRNWTQSKFGGWGVWLNDLLFHALLAARAGDAPTARANLEVALTGQQPEGNLACLLTAYTEWVDRSQPPIGAYVALRMFLLTGDRALLEQAYPTLRRAHDWWFTHRDGNGNGVLEHGSSPTGEGTFVHTKQGAMDEAAMDNLPLFDDAAFDERGHTLDLEEVGLNSLVVLDGQMLSRIATLLGRADEAAALMERADALAARVRERLWDPEREVFSARRWSGEWVQSLAPTSFYPLVAGIATPEQADALVHRHLLDPERFWGPRPLPASTYDDPATPDDVYWRGRIWPPLVFLTWEGLRRAGYVAEATELAERAWTLFADEWTERRRCRENYKIDPAADPEVDDSDGFYTWGALLALTALLERGDASPWSGLTLAPGGEVTFGGVRWAMREGVIERAGVPVLELSPPVAVSELEVGATVAFATEVPEGGLDVRVVGSDVVHLEAGQTRFDSGKL
jgi:putative isomerase